MSMPSEDGKRRSTRGERAAMGSGVDAEGAAGNHQPAPAGRQVGQ